jgi:hypothetical protein
MAIVAALPKLSKVFLKFEKLEIPGLGAQSSLTHEMDKSVILDFPCINV